MEGQLFVRSSPSLYQLTPPISLSLFLAYVSWSNAKAWKLMRKDLTELGPRV